MGFNWVCPQMASFFNAGKHVWDSCLGEHDKKPWGFYEISIDIRHIQTNPNLSWRSGDDGDDDDDDG